MLALRVLAFVAGALVAAATVASAVRTVVLPRGIPAKLTRTVFLGLRFLFRLRMGKRATYARRDRVMALYAPTGLLALLVTWLALLTVGYAGMFWGIGAGSFREAFVLSGSSGLTLGFARPETLSATILALSEGVLGLLLLALLITYLPTIYGAFSRREVAVALLEVRAGSPPSGVEMLERFWRLGRMDLLTQEVWIPWEASFVEIEESHTSFPTLVFFRSPQPDRSWVTASGAVLDGAALLASTLEIPRQTEADLTIRAGYICLRRIADFFRIPYEPDPKPDDPISITRDEYDDVYDRLEALGAPLKEREQAWRDFAGWRVNYDTVLIALASLTDAPYAPWSSDRSPLRWRPRLFMPRRRARV